MNDKRPPLDFDAIKVQLNLLTNKQKKAYSISVPAKSGVRIGVRLQKRTVALTDSVFFVPCNCMSASSIMAGCEGEPSGSPFSFLDGTPIFHRLSPIIGVMPTVFLKFRKGDCNV